MGCKRSELIFQIGEMKKRKKRKKNQWEWASKRFATAAPCVGLDTDILKAEAYL